MIFDVPFDRCRQDRGGLFLQDCQEESRTTYCFSSLNHWNSAGGTAMASQRRRAVFPIGVCESVTSVMVGGSGKTERRVFVSWIEPLSLAGSLFHNQGLPGSLGILQRGPQDRIAATVYSPDCEKSS